MRLSVSELSQTDYEKLAFVVGVLQNTQSLVISRCCFVEHGKLKVYIDLKRTCTAIVLLIKPVVWWRSRCLCRRGLLKVPIKARLHRRFLSRQSCNLKIPSVNQVRFSVRFVAAISQGFRACLKLDATKIASSCRDKNRLCNRALGSLRNHDGDAQDNVD